jgi:DNA polymerase (family 10)
MKLLSNQEIAHVLFEVATLYEMRNETYKARAYEHVAFGVQSFTRPIIELYGEEGREGLKKVSGVGEGIARHLEQLIKTGHLKRYDQLKKKVPVNISELVSVEGVGPKTVRVLWEQLGIRNVEDLEKAARTHQIRKLPHFGEKSEEKILRGILFLKRSGGRRPLGFLLLEVRKLQEVIQAFPETDQVEVVGSIRRRLETVGDIDILATSSRPEKVIERFVALPQVEHIYGYGETKAMVRLTNGLDADLRVVAAESFGSALIYFTGSKEHNIALRERALRQGWKLNEYGLFAGEEEIRLGGATEEEVYEKLGLQCIPPELRENKGEIEAARTNSLPWLIDYDDLRGDLQIQTNWTDGAHSIEEMAEAAEEYGLEYIVITDHTKSLAMAGGADEKKLMRQMKEIDRLNSQLRKQGRNMTVLKGAEVNILKDGSLDIADEVLAQLDVVGAAIHSHFDLSKQEQMERLWRVMHNPHVDIIFHLTTRIINRRKPIELNIDEVIRIARETGTVLEIDAYPDRLDIKDEFIRKCVEAGIKMSIDSDAHDKQHFAFLEIGIAQARRGWATREAIVNTRPLPEFLKLLKDRGVKEKQKRSKQSVLKD